MLNLDIAHQIYRNEDINNPQYIFHGHPLLLDKIIPRVPEKNKSKNSLDTQFGIYGSVKINGAIPYSITVQKEYDDWNGAAYANYFIPPEYDYEVAVVHFGYIDDDSTGYIYVLDASTFTYSNEYQWVSKTPIKPLDIIPVSYQEVSEHFLFPHLKKKINERI